MKKSLKIACCFALIGLSQSSFAKESINAPKHPEPTITRAGCSPTTATIDLDVNNVRARLMNGGDMWWDRGPGVAAYEVPKGDGKVKKNSLFAGSLWVGGKDNAAGGLLKVAAQTYRQRGNDYWSGPLDDNANIDANVCALWDRFWKINQTDILTFKSIFAGLTDPQAVKDQILANQGKVPAVIKEWPAKGNTSAKGSGGVSLNIPSNKDYAPFEDRNGDGIYNWQDGDCPKIVGDQYIWWIFNDKGNVQTNTQGLPLGLEIQASAFAFATNDCLNDATFYNYRLMNKSTSTYSETYTATWSDADLGYYLDDYVGCDVGRGLGILYNSDDFDDGSTGYGTEIPMIGIDFFQGPLSTVDGFPDSVAPLKMKYFTFFNNGDPSPTGDPDNDAEYYNFMTGKWQDGTPFVKNCQGIGAGTASNYAFPDEYRECNPCGNPPGDRRFVHSAGPFEMKPGIANDITIGAVWVPNVGGNCPSYGKLRICDDKAQLLFDGGFKLPFGPQAPDMAIKPFDSKLVFYINNPYGSNNFNEQYGNPDSSAVYKENSPLAQGAKSYDSLYKFEGYMVFQLKNPTTSVSQIRMKDGTFDPAKAKLVFQCDKKNGIKNIFNFEKDPEISEDYFQARLMASGRDSGIVNNFELKTDAFASGSQNGLVNYRTYYYAVIAYSYNNFSPFNVQTGTGQSFQYLESRTDGRQAPLHIYKVTPHPAYDNIYTDTKTTYGDGIEIIRLEGKGNGGNNLELTDASIEEALASPESIVKNPVYKPGFAPINVKITDADSIKPGEYTIYLNAAVVANGTTRDSSWGAFGPKTTWNIVRSYQGKNDTIYSDNSIQTYNEKLLTKWGVENNAANPTEDWGISIGMQQQARPGDTASNGDLINNSILEKNNSGYISSSITYEDVSKAWLYGVPDAEKNSPNNWLRCGDYLTPSGEATWHSIAMDDYDNFKDANTGEIINRNQDKKGNYEKILGGTWGPYYMANNQNSVYSGMGIMYTKLASDRNFATMFNCHSVDVVFTNDRSKWTKCCVIEMNDGSTSNNGAVNGNPISEGGAWKYNLRNHPSLEKFPDANGNPVYSTSDSGHSWFPGYAINIETGERLNIMFGEDSGDPINNGKDMMFNPTSTYFDPVNGALKWGGHHVLYISRSRYDAETGSDSLYNNLKQMAGVDPAASTTLQKLKRSVFSTMMWVTPAMKIGGKNLLSWKEGIVPTKATVKIRVERPYVYFNPGTTLINGGMPTYRFNTDKILASGLTSAGNQYNANESALLDRLNIVPNPYYAYSEYEATRLDNRVKIINLPAVATIKIYSVDGALIKTINKADAGTTYVEWDIKNEKGVPIASGLYLVHIKIKTDQGEKERVLKWFGIMRPTDITAF